MMMQTVWLSRILERITRDLWYVVGNKHHGFTKNSISPFEEAQNMQSNNHSGPWWLNVSID